MGNFRGRSGVELSHCGAFFANRGSKRKGERMRREWMEDTALRKFKAGKKAGERKEVTALRNIGTGFWQKKKGETLRMDRRNSFKQN